MPPRSETFDAVRAYALPIEGNPFDELLASARFETLGKGRRGAVLVNVDEAGDVPIVRTTTKYALPSQHFRPAHERLARQIQAAAALSVSFNNALIECYTNAYATMGSHSDQALDLAGESHIALFSCYQCPESSKPARKLIVEPKEDAREAAEIPLAHNSVVVFSVDANRRLKHKIVLDAAARPPENQWLGVTFRTSKTLVRFREGRAYLADGAVLTLATEDEAREFYGLRRRENQEVDFAYPRIRYTVSASDMVRPEIG